MVFYFISSYTDSTMTARSISCVAGSITPVWRNPYDLWSVLTAMIVDPLITPVSLHLKYPFDFRVI